MRLDGKCVVIAGGGSVGRAFAHGLAEEGARLVIADIDGAKAMAAAEEVTRKGGEAISITADVADSWSLSVMAEQAANRFGGIDVLINSAGRHMREFYAGCLDMPEDTLREMFEVNSIGPLLTVRACVPYMRARGEGVVINRSSVAAYAPRNPYAASRLAVHALTAALADDLAKDNIRVNCIAVGLLDTGLTMRSLSIEKREKLIGEQKIHRHGRTDDLVGTLLFLVGDDSSFITGQTIIVDGGRIDRL